MSDADKIALAKAAIVHVLRRMRVDDQLRFHLGYGTEAFDLLTKAAAELTDEPLSEVENFALGREFIA